MIEQRKKNFLIICALSVIVVGLVIAIIYCFSRANSQDSDRQMKEDMDRLSGETYESIFLSMHSPQYFTEEDFFYFRGQDTIVTTHAISNSKELFRYLDCIFRSDNVIASIYLCLDPELLWAEFRQKESNWDKGLENSFYFFVKEHPEVTFEVLLPYPCIDYWTGMDEKAFRNLLTLYHTFVNELCDYNNIKVFFPGFEEWLIINPANYTNTLFDANPIITQKLFLYIFCDGVYRITPENEDSFWESLRNVVEREKNTPTSYPDLSDWNIVFFGDSVLANYEGSYSIPGYIAGLSNASTFNFAVGGTSAVSGFSAAFRRFEEAEFPAVGKKFCFVINYGLNDYFTGCLIENPQNPYDESSYKGVLRTYISKLQVYFPDACYIVMTPTHISCFENGTSILSENGATLSAYIDAAQEITQEMSIWLIDNYNDFEITEENMAEYLSDGIHPNGNGRLAIARQIMRFMESM